MTSIGPALDDHHRTAWKQGREIPVVILKRISAQRQVPIAQARSHDSSRWKAIALPSTADVTASGDEQARVPTGGRLPRLRELR
jgi:hypothetical protein